MTSLIIDKHYPNKHDQRDHAPISRRWLATRSAEDFRQSVRSTIESIVGSRQLSMNEAVSARQKVFKQLGLDTPDKYEHAWTEVGPSNSTKSNYLDAIDRVLGQSRISNDLDKSVAASIEFAQFLASRLERRGQTIWRAETGSRGSHVQSWTLDRGSAVNFGEETEQPFKLHSRKLAAKEVVNVPPFVGYYTEGGYNDEMEVLLYVGQRQDKSYGRQSLMDEFLDSVVYDEPVTNWDIAETREDPDDDWVEKALRDAIDVVKAGTVEGAKKAWLIRRRRQIEDLRARAVAMRDAGLLARANAMAQSMARLQQASLVAMHLPSYHDQASHGRLRQSYSVKKVDKKALLIAHGLWQVGLDRLKGGTEDQQQSVTVLASLLDDLKAGDAPNVIGLYDQSQNLQAFVALRDEGNDLYASWLSAAPWNVGKVKGWGRAIMKEAAKAAAKVGKGLSADPMTAQSEGFYRMLGMTKVSDLEYRWGAGKVKDFLREEKSEPYIVEPISKAESDILLNIAENGAHLDDVFWEQFKVEINRLVQRGYAYFTDTSGGGPGYSQRTVTLTQKGIDALAMWRRETGGRLQSLVADVMKSFKGHAGRPGQVGGSVSMYHGTSLQAAEKIKKEGIKAKYAGKHWSLSDKGHVFVTKSSAAAAMWARRSMIGKGSSGNKRWAVVRVTIPASELKKLVVDKDASDEDRAARMFKGDIPAKWIDGVFELPRDSGNYGDLQNRETGEWLRQKSMSEDDVTVYAVLDLDGYEKMLSEAMK